MVKGHMPLTYHSKQQHATSCNVIILCVCYCVTAVLSKINCILDFFAINLLIAIKKLIAINVCRINCCINCD